MSDLDSSLEALAYNNSVNLGPLLTAAINSLWAWVAVVAAAALSFWHLRSSTKPLIMPPPAAEPETASLSGERVIEDTRSETTSSRGEKKEEEEGVLTRGDSFKNRFTVYYNEVEERENEDDDDDADEMDGGDEAVVRRWGRVSTVEIGRKDLGLGLWYSCQDRRVIDGSVVRLWN